MLFTKILTPVLTAVVRRAVGHGLNVLTSRGEVRAQHDDHIVEFLHPEGSEKLVISRTLAKVLGVEVTDEEHDAALEEARLRDGGTPKPAPEPESVVEEPAVQGAMTTQPPPPAPTKPTPAGL